MNERSSHIVLLEKAARFIAITTDFPRKRDKLLIEIDAFLKANECPNCINGIIRSLGRDNEEIVEDCPDCGRPLDVFMPYCPRHDKPVNFGHPNSTPAAK